MSQMVIRAAALALACAAAAPAWIESVEFPWNTYPAHLAERELVWLKNIGIRHVSLPPGSDTARLRETVNIIRRLNLEADLEGPVPDELQPLTRAHGGPLTDPLPAGTVRISALDSGTLNRQRRAIGAHTPAVLWSRVEDTIGTDGFRPGAVNFAGEEKPATAALRRAALLSGYWGDEFARMSVERGAALIVAPGGKASAGISAVQFTSPGGASAVSFINDSNTAWRGDFRAIERGGKPLMLPGVSVPAHGAMMFPVHVPLVPGPLCAGCSGLASSDYLVYATAELTAIEYENGILAMEFSAPAAGEAVVQLDREPVGPLVAAGKPVGFDSDTHAMRFRLPIPAGTGPGNHVRIGLAIEAPDHTGYFENARVLLIGQANHLTAQFSSSGIAARSRLRITPDLPVKKQEPTAVPAEGSSDPVRAIYDVSVPPDAVHGDHAELVLEADAIQMSHVRPQILQPVTLRFADPIQVRLSRESSYALYPSALAVNARTGRDVTVSIRNNAPEIRTFKLSIAADGLEFSPASAEVSVGASASRDVSFRVFATGAAPGVHTGAVSLSGAAAREEPFRVVVIPAGREIAWSADGFYFLENTASRASFLPGTWLESLVKEQGRDRLTAPVTPFSPGPITVVGDALSFAGGKTLRLADLDAMTPKEPRKETPQRTQTRPRQ